MPVWSVNIIGLKSQSPSPMRFFIPHLWAVCKKSAIMESNLVPGQVIFRQGEEPASLNWLCIEVGLILIGGEFFKACLRKYSTTTRSDNNKGPGVVWMVAKFEIIYLSISSIRLNSSLS